MATLIALAAFALVSVLAILVLYSRGVREQRQIDQRRASLAAAAAQREWSFVARDAALVDRFPGAPFGKGNDRSATNVLLGRYNGRDFVAYDYDYTTPSSNKSISGTTHHWHSVVAVDLGMMTPGLAVGPTDLFGKLINALAGHDVKVGVPAFDQAFTVTSPSPEFAVEVLHPGVVQVVMEHPQLAWRLMGDSMVIIRSGQHSPQEIEAKLHFMDAVLDRVPEHVRARLQGEPPR